jgi:hypothetical protein
VHAPQEITHTATHTRTRSGYFAGYVCGVIFWFGIPFIGAILDQGYPRPQKKAPALKRAWRQNYLRPLWRQCVAREISETIPRAVPLKHGRRGFSFGAALEIVQWENFRLGDANGRGFRPPPVTAWDPSLASNSSLFSAETPCSLIHSRISGRLMSGRRSWTNAGSSPKARSPLSGASPGNGDSFISRI